VSGLENEQLGVVGSVESVDEFEVVRLG